MKRLLFLQILVVTVCYAKPNFVFIIADDLTYRDIGCYGGQAHTPHIDHLATEGMKFERCFQAASMCSPTRHNIYTGLYPFNSGAYPNHTFANLGTKSVVHYLGDLGYRVALSGKVHVAPKEVFPFEYSGVKNNPDMNAIDKLMLGSSSSDEPFCLFATSNEPHSPWNKGDTSLYPPDKVILPPYIVDTPRMREDFSNYLAEITYYDSQVGEILTLLDKHGLRHNTLVMVVSEQGNAFPFAKWTCYGSGLQSAMIVRWPGMVSPGKTTDALVEYTDVLPTFIEAAGGKPAKLLDGKSMISLLRGKTNHHKKYVYGEVTTRGIINGADLYPIRTIRDDRFRLVWNLNPEVKYTNSLTRTPAFLSMVEKAKSGKGHAQEFVLRYQHRPELELFDCQTDPLEMNNLAENPEYRGTIRKLKDKLQQWMDSQGDRGIQTERDSIYRHRSAIGKTKEEVDAAWAKKNNRK